MLTFEQLQHLAELCRIALRHLNTEILGEHHPGDNHPPMVETTRAMAYLAGVHAWAIDAEAESERWKTADV